MKMTIVLLTLYLINYGFGESTGINFVDSTPIEVCDNHRIYSRKVFKGGAFVHNLFTHSKSMSQQLIVQYKKNAHCMSVFSSSIFTF